MKWGLIIIYIHSDIRRRLLVFNAFFMTTSNFGGAQPPLSKNGVIPLPPRFSASALHKLLLDIYVYALHYWMTSYQRSLPTRMCVWARDNVDARSKTTHVYMHTSTAHTNKVPQFYITSMLYCGVGNSTMANFKVSLRISTGISWC